MLRHIVENETVKKIKRMAFESHPFFVLKTVSEQCYFAFQSLRSWGFSIYEGIFSKILFMRAMSNLGVRS